METRSTFQSLLESSAGGALPQWDSVASGLSLRKFSAGETVFQQGVEHPYVYAVQQGLVKLCYLSDDGTEWVKSFSCEGGFFGSIAALRPQGRTTFMVVALEPSTVERIDYRLLATLAGKHLAWAAALQGLTMAFAARKEERERELLTLNAQQRYLAFCDAHPNLQARIPQKDLARHLGVTPVGLNRIVMRLRHARA